MTKAKVVMLWEHYLLLVGGDMIKALLLDRLIFYSEQQAEMIDLLKEEQAEGHLPEFKEKVNLDRLKGWVRKSSSHLADSLMIGESERTIQRKLEELGKVNLIFIKSEKGRASSYRPNLLYIEMELKKLGFTIKGERLSKEIIHPPEDQTQQELWDSIPGASEGKPLSALQRTEWQEWAAGYKLLDNAPEATRKASWIIFKATGFEPYDKSWLAQVTSLLGIVKGDEALLEQALAEGEKMRQANGFVYSGPRAYQTAAKNVMAQRNQGPIKVSTNGQHKPDDGVIRIGG